MIRMVELTFETLHKARAGLYARILKTYLNRITRDCVAVPRITEWRKMRLDIWVRPKQLREAIDGGQGDLESMEIAVKFPNVSLPTRVGLIEARPDWVIDREGNRTQQPVFAFETPDNIAQHSLEFPDEQIDDQEEDGTPGAGAEGSDLA